jgi:hypothetical protein
LYLPIIYSYSFITYGESVYQPKVGA